MVRKRKDKGGGVSFGKIKILAEDKLYSEIIRFGKTRCQRCDRHNQLQCCHIMGRASKATRWLLEPVKNAVALCMPCHVFFDSHKDNTPIFVEGARKYSKPEANSYAFLVYCCGYSWNDLKTLYVMANHKTTKMYDFEKVEIKRQLKAHLEMLKNAGPYDSA